MAASKSTMSGSRLEVCLSTPTPKQLAESRLNRPQSIAQSTSRLASASSSFLTDQSAVQSPSKVVISRRRTFLSDCLNMGSQGKIHSLAVGSGLRIPSGQFVCGTPSLPI